MMVAQKTYPRLQQQYKDEISTKLMEQFGLGNVNQLPKLSKVVINVGVGKLLENQKLKPDIRETVISTLTTLRRDQMWHFLDRLINLAAPRIKDFRGLKEKAFDTGGSYSFGLTEQAVWPEIDMANVTFNHGMNINIVFEQSSPEMSKFLLSELGFPFAGKNDKS